MVAVDHPDFVNSLILFKFVFPREPGGRRRFINQYVAPDMLEDFDTDDREEQVERVCELLASDEAELRGKTIERCEDPEMFPYGDNAWRYLFEVTDDD